MTILQQFAKFWFLIAQPLPSQMRFWQGVYYNPCPLLYSPLLSSLAPVRGLLLLPYNLATNEDIVQKLSGYDHKGTLR